MENTQVEVKKDDFSQDLVMFQPYDLVIAKMKEEYSNLTINGVDDKEGYAKVHSARMNVKNKRIEVDKVTKTLTEIAVRRNKAIYNERNRIVEMLSPIESDLEEKENAINQERLRIKKEENEKLDRLAQSRAEQLIALGDLAPNYLDLKVMTEEMFQRVLFDQKKWYDEETVRLEKQKEEDRLAKIKADAERAEREALQKKLDDERRVLEAQKAEFEKQQAEAARKAKEEEDRKAKEIEIKRRAEIEAKRLMEEKEKARQIAEERAKEQAERARKKAEKLERLKPDKARMLDLRDAILAVQLPVVKSQEYTSCVETVKSRLGVAASFIDDVIKKSEE